jgi:hypothetical protein
MKIYNMTPAFISSNLATDDVGFNFYYSDAHLNIGANNVVDYVQTNMEVVTQDFIGSAGATVGLIAGNNSPLTIISPEYAPYPFAGNCAIAYIKTTQGGLTTAEKELEEDFEFIINKAANGTISGYIVWGTFKVTKTDFYTPQLMAQTGVANFDVPCLSWNPIDGLEHSSLDYSEKMPQVIES